MSLKEVKNYINKNRRDFADKPFSEEMASNDPIEQYSVWFKEAMSSNIVDPYAACLSTVDSSGRPSSRILYIRDFNKDGFIFYTNYDSKKGYDILENNYGALNVFWGELERQIRIKGLIKKVDDSKSDKYFNDRPRASQIGAWASDQSQKIKNRNELESKIRFFEDKFKGINIPRPSNWGGYNLSPYQIEFWQGRPSRLHDRILYVKENNQWVKSRLSP